MDVPDLVRDSKLETRFHPKYTTHRFHELDSNSGTRNSIREEYWRRQSFIGGGSYGRVWLEKCVKGGRDQDVRAVKEITKSPLARRYDYYTRELEAIAKFSHSRFHSMFDVLSSRSDGMSKMTPSTSRWNTSPLGDLNDHLASSPALPETETKEVIFQLLEGLNFLHENGFAHRDLKPSNILVKGKPPEKWWVKIGDFGISKRAAAGIDASSTLKGTLGFMPPELHGFVDSADCFDEDTQAGASSADIWSLGEITFQLLTKGVCFKNMGILSAYVSKPDMFPAKMLQERAVSSEGIDLVRSLMLPAPRRRFTASEAMTHVWVASCRIPSPRPLSLASLELSGNVGDSALTDGAIRPEPSGRWSTISPPPVGEHEFQDKTLPRMTGTMITQSIDSSLTNRTTTTDQDTSASNTKSTLASTTSPDPETNPHHYSDLLASASPPDSYHRNQDLDGHNTTSWPLKPGHHHDGSFDSRMDKHTVPAHINRLRTSEGLRSKFFTISDDGSGRVLDENSRFTGQTVDSNLGAHLMGRLVTPIMSGSRRIGWETSKGDLYYDSVIRQHFDANEDVSPPTSTENQSMSGSHQMVNRVNLSHGVFSLDVPQDAEFLVDVDYAMPPIQDEFTHYRYTAATCDTRDFLGGFNIRQHGYFAQERKTELLIAISFPSGWPKPWKFHQIFGSIRYACTELCRYDGFRQLVLPQQTWKSIVVLFSGNSEIGDIAPLFAELGLQQDWTKIPQVCPVEILEQQHVVQKINSIEGVPDMVRGCFVRAHIYEYTTTKWLYGPESGFVGAKYYGHPMQIILCKMPNSSVRDQQDWSHTISTVLDAKLTIGYDCSKENRVVRSKDLIETWKDKRPFGNRRKVVNGFDTNTKRVMLRVAGKILSRR